MRDIIEDVNKIYGLDHDQVNSLSDQVKEKNYVCSGNSRKSIYWTQGI